MKNAKVCILDYGSGNVASVYNLINRLDYDIKVSNKPEDIKKSSHLILPGVGAFGASVERIKSNISIELLNDEVKVNKKPFLGICVGMQVLAEKGLEFGVHKGLGWIEGTVEKLSEKVLPHVGWNNIEIKKNSPIFKNIKNASDFYFVNSYAFRVKDNNCIIAETTYENKFCSAIQKENIFGVQFHPEKSQKMGQIIIDNFLKI
tara:strand:- start:251 stop:862 length:612 start_codon:yes stop_codon:yes gene_type:complete